MRKLALTLLTLLTFTVIPPSHADSSIYIVDKPHQLFDGSFLDDELATSLLPSGKLGSYVYSPPRSSVNWYVDGALLQTIFEMSDGYTLVDGTDGEGSLAAKSWLTRFALSTSGDKVFSLAYGNPDLEVAGRLAPSELSAYFEYGRSKVESLIPGHKVETAPLSVSTGKSTLSAPLQKVYTQNRQALTKLSAVVDSQELKTLRSSLSIVMNPLLAKKDQLLLSQSAMKEVATFVDKLQVTNGKYQLTSANVKVPVTLKNDFDKPVTLFLRLSPSNTRVVVDKKFEVTIPANSRTQFSVPFTVIAPGATVVTAQLTNSQGQAIGAPALLSLNLSIFDSRVAWFTSGAGILLLIAAITQTIRRVRRSRK